MLALAGAAVALTAGFAGVTFVRLIGLIVLGKPAPRRRARPQRDYGPLGRAGIVLLWPPACLALAALTPLEIRVIAAGLAPVVPAAVTAGRAEITVGGAAGVRRLLDPVAVLAVVVMPVLCSLWSPWPPGGRPGSRLIAGAAGPGLAVGHRRGGRARTATPRSASPTRPAGSWPRSCIPGRRSATSADAQAHRGRALATGGGLEAPGGAAAPAHIGYSSDVIEVVEDYLYRPVLRPVMALVRPAKRLQSGRLDAYLAYMLIALIALLALVAALH